LIAPVVAFFRIKPSDAFPLVIPAKTGVSEAGERENSGKPWGNPINRNAPDLDSRFRGMTKSGIALRSEVHKNSFKTIHPTLSPFTPSFGKRLNFPEFFPRILFPYLEK
jgi:hypothetical protein